VLLGSVHKFELLSLLFVEFVWFSGYIHVRPAVLPCRLGIPLRPRFPTSQATAVVIEGGGALALAQCSSTSCVA
jgi:hypothetical protein